MPKVQTTDICDGEAQGHDGINYSLCSREMMTNMIEIQYCATPFDGCVFLSSCDKAAARSFKSNCEIECTSYYDSWWCHECRTRFINIRTDW